MQRIVLLSFCGPISGRGLCPSARLLLFRRSFALSPKLRQVKDAEKLAKRAQKISELRRLISLAAPVKYRLTAGVFLLGISSVVTMSVPYFLGKMMDFIFSAHRPEESSPQQDSQPLSSLLHRVQPQKPSQDPSQATQDGQKVMDKLGRVCLILTGVFLVGASANFGRSYLMATAGQRVVNRLRTKTFSSIVRQELGFFDRSRTGELVNRLSNDATLVGQAVTTNISDGLRSTVAALGGTGMMFFVSSKLALVGLAIVPPVSIVAIMYGRFVRKIVKQMNDALAAATQVAEERIANIRTVRAFAAEPREDQRYSKEIESILGLAKRNAFYSAVFFATMGLSGNVVMLAILYAGGFFVTAGELTIGELSAFLLYAIYVGVSIGGLSGFWAELQRGLGASTRLFELVDRQSAIPISGGLRPDSLLGEIRFQNVRFAYPARPDVPVLADFSLYVPEGSVTALVGGSGSGKSTVSALLLRFYEADQGQILVDGQDICSLDPSWLRRQIGTVSQDPVLFSATIRENIAYGAEDSNSISEGQIEEAARKAYALDFIHSFPEGLDTLVGERGVTLSGGQRQRIAIARALLNNPKLLILDEATSALDAESEWQVRLALQSLLTGAQRTVFIIAHRLSTIRNADQIGVVADGKLAELGTYEELMGKTEGRFRRLVQKQTDITD